MAATRPEDIKGFKVKELKDWLLSHDDIGDDYKEDIEILEEARFRGKAFLNLNAEKLDKLNVSDGFKEAVLILISEIISEETDGAAAPNPKKPRIQLPASENDFYYCMTGYKVLPTQRQVSNQASMSSASVPILNDGKPAIWSNYKELRVRFLYDEHVNPVNYDKNRIMEWANEWNVHGHNLSLPRFRLAKPEEKAEIRVKLNNKKCCQSYVGREADWIDENEATMELDIHTGLPAGTEPAIRYMKYLVMHEFGHALGLRHEHQRSDFWRCIEHFVDITKMKASIRGTFGQIRDEDFEECWRFQWSEQTGVVAMQNSYDRASIMHYWFLKDWFDWNKYDSRRKVLDEKIKNTMDAIRNSEFLLADEPSDNDIKLLEELYGVKDNKGRAAAPSSVVTDVCEPQVGGETRSGKKRKGVQSVAQASTQQATRLTDDDMGTVTNEIWKVRASFYNLGMNLKIDAGTLDVAKREGDDGEALNLVIKTWLKKNKPKPTWKALIQALRQKNMKAETLAEKIATKYCPDEISTDSEEDGGETQSGITGKESTQQGQGQQSPLDPKQLNKVFNELHEARVRWYAIGLELGVAANDLDAVDTKNRGDPDICMRAVLQKFLHGKSADSKRWIQLAEALESPTVGFGYLGQQIRKKY